MALAAAGIALAGGDGLVTGQYLEDRSNRVYGCPCERSSEFMNNGREAVLAWSIESGRFEGQDLAGLRMAAALVGIFTLSEPTSLRRSTIYVDSAAPEPQRRAGVAWLRARFGDVLGTVLTVREAPIAFSMAPDSAEVQVAGTLDVRLRRADIAQDTQPWGALIYDPFIRLAQATLGTPLRTHYAGSELAIRWRREDAIPWISGYYGTFALP